MPWHILDLLVTNFALLVAGAFALSLTFKPGRVAATTLAVRAALTVASSFILLSHSLPLAPGLMFDLRAVPIALATYWGGARMGLALSVPVIAYRLHLGGNGAVPAAINLVLVVLISSLLTRLASRHLRSPRERTLSTLAAFGIPNLLVFAAYSAAGRPFGEALSTYLSITLLDALGLVAAGIVINTRQRAMDRNAALEQMAFLDPLTGIPNRRQFDMDTGGAPLNGLYLLLLDIDHFKQVNDTYGHDRGDQVLQAVAQVMQASLRGSDRAYRFGGEEFVLLLHTATAEQALDIVHRLRRNVAATAGPKAGLPEVRLTFSGGLVPLVGQASIDEAIQDADQLLYQAKGNGRDQVRTQTLRSGRTKA